jgi:predicted ATPase/DNA-binding CsgD family transcriptional regulator
MAEMSAQRLTESDLHPEVNNRLLLQATHSPPIGRDTARTDLADRLRAGPARLHTVVGAVGVGKSRLALTVANDLTRAGNNVATFVHLPGATGRLGATLAAAAEAGDPAFAVLDGCDGIDAAELDTLAGALREHPALRVMTTAREPLRLPGEALFRLGPLPVPAADTPLTALAECPSVALFLQHAAAVRPTFALTEDNRAVVAAICRLLDGLPLAIECAARALTVFQPPCLLARLREGLDALDSVGRTTTAGLSQALAAHIGRLPSAASDLLEKLAEFESGFDIASVEAVSGTPPGETQRDLAMLVDRSLVEVDEPWDWSIRFSLSGTTRAFLRARSEKAAREQTADRLAEHFLTVVADGGRAINQPEADLHLRTLSAAHDDIERAFRHLLSTERAAEALRLAAGLTGHWIDRGDPATGLAWLEEGLAAPGGADSAALTAAGELAGHLGQHELAWERHATAYDLARSAGLEGGQEALRLALTGIRGGRSASTLAHLVRLPSATGPGADLGVAAFRFAQGMPSAAHALATSARTAFRKRDDAYGAAAAIALLSEVAIAEKDGDAETLCREALTAVRVHDPRGITPRCLETLAVVYASGRSGRTRWAVQLLGAAQRRRDNAHLAASVSQTVVVRTLTARLKAELGSATYAKLWTAGYETPMWTLLDQPTGPPNDGESVSKLTPRQREVAHLIGLGLTNREIARRLGVAEWTAVNHVRQVLRKLNCASRVQVARLVVQDEVHR